MQNDANENVQYMTLIAGRKQKDHLLTMLAESGACLISTLYGRGSVKASYLKNVLGLVPEEHKVIITCVLTSEKAAAVLATLAGKFNFEKPNTGIAFTTPVDRVSF